VCAITRGLLPAYVGIVIVAFLVAASRLHESTDMPGLAAIELVLLALPWSLALGIQPMSRLELGGMTAIVVSGIVINGMMVRTFAGWVTRLAMASRAKAGMQPRNVDR
jgi:hypothetical protein